MSVWRRMMLWSESWNTSTRLRPRSLAALQAISAVASACARALSARPTGATPMLTGDLEGSLAGARHDRPRPRRGSLRRSPPPPPSRCSESAPRAGRPRCAPTARRAAALRARHSATLDDHVVAHVHAEGLVDDVQPVDVEVEDAVRASDARRRRRGEQGVACRSKACRVISPVLESYCAWMMIVAFFASSSAMRVWCASKSSRARRIEQRQHAHDALRRVADRAGENLVGRGRRRSRPWRCG